MFKEVLEEAPATSDLAMEAPPRDVTSNMRTHCAGEMKKGPRGKSELGGPRAATSNIDYNEKIIIHRLRTATVDRPTTTHQQPALMDLFTRKTRKTFKQIRPLHLRVT